MSKRKAEIVSKESELGRHEDIWLGNVFPLLSQEDGVTKLWLTLCMVSWFWYNMVCRIKEHCFTNGPAHLTQIPILIMRFAENTVKLKTCSIFGPYLRMFPSLRVLHLTGFPSKIEIGKLVNLTSLTLDKNTRVNGMENLENLSELSILHLDNATVRDVKISELQNIKKLSLGRCSHYIERVYLLALIPEKSSLEYLECDDKSVFKSISYTGQGKWRDHSQNFSVSYEGGWSNGSFHGDGVLDDKHRYIGKWENGLINRGKIIYHHSSFYEGELCTLRGDEDDDIIIFPHGKGKRVHYNNIYEGDLNNGMYHGKGVLHKDGEVIHSGKWEFDLPV